MHLHRNPQHEQIKFKINKSFKNQNIKKSFEMDLQREVQKTKDNFIIQKIGYPNKRRHFEEVELNKVMNSNL